VAEPSSHRLLFHFRSSTSPVASSLPQAQGRSSTNSRFAPKDRHRAGEERFAVPQWNGKFSLIRFSSVASTTATFASCRFRFALFEASKCRRPAWARNTLPDPVTLKRLATDFFVLRLAIGFGIGSGECSRPTSICKPQLRKCTSALDWSDWSYMTKRPMERSHPQDEPAAIQPRNRLFVSLDRRT
jgi:hypothetical protein